MKKFLSPVFDVYRKYRAFKSKSRLFRLYRGLSFLLGLAVVTYFLLLCFPQVLFANEVSHKNIKVYSSRPLDQGIYQILEKAEAKLSASEIYDPAVNSKIFLADGYGTYAFFSIHVNTRSFAKGYPLLPTNNIFVNKSDIANDVVSRNSQTDNERSLSGVIAHEVTHLLIKRKFGLIKNLSIPTWKKEGYCEYVAGGSLLDYETGIRRWKENPKNDTAYRYFKYYLMVKFLIEIEKLNAEEIFNNDFDEKVLEAKIFNSLS